MKSSTRPGIFFKETDTHTMSQQVLTPPEETVEPQLRSLDHTELLPIGTEGSIWESLVGNVRDVFRPKKLPPLELTSQPVEVQDPFATKRSPWSSVAAILFYIGLALLLFFWPKTQPQIAKKEVFTPLDIAPYLPKAPAPKVSGGGGGGGNHEITPPTKGKLPEFKKDPIVPPQILTVEHPKLAAPAAIKMPDIKEPDQNLPNIGIPQAPNATLSAGSGNGGIGTGKGGGLGIGSGAGLGPGEGGLTGGGVAHPGGGVSSPKLIYSVDPEFSDEARRQKYQGVVVLSIIVDAQGLPQRIRVIRHLGLGLDEKAMEAVKQYKFRPAQAGGKPVPVEINIEVNFQLF